jgi:hypothetical protein
MHPVKPTREADQKPLHELTRIMRPLGETDVDHRHAGVGGVSSLIEVIGHETARKNPTTGKILIHPQREGK